MVTQVRSISQTGATEPFELQIARGQIPGHSREHKFGSVPAMSTGQSGTIWDVNDTTYPWASYTAAAVVNIERNDAADEGLVVVVEGLDADYNAISDTITISGTDTLGTVQFLRVNRAFVTSGQNTGNIDIEYGAAGGATIARITAGQGQTLMAVYTVPANKTLYLTQIASSCEEGAESTVDLFTRFFGQDSFRIQHILEVAGGGHYRYPFNIPLRFPEKTDIDLRAAVRSNNARITAVFDAILIDEEGPL